TSSYNMVWEKGKAKRRQFFASFFVAWKVFFGASALFPAENELQYGCMLHKKSARGNCKTTAQPPSRREGGWDEFFAIAL
ncbi:MAG: hypothetical protein IJJ33_08580, partial [Victivallales bacterium]|nr:hypothetical protein [Victivallales bacterium]